jgi:sodium transport system ATP-binding protein
MILAEELVKTFPTPDAEPLRAVDGLSFCVRPGEIYGLLGPNGAGKTTTLRILSGLMRPTSGRAVVAGFDVATQLHEVKRRIGFLTASTGLYQRLTPREMLVYFAQLHGHDRAWIASRVAELIAWLGMGSFADLRCGALSTGQRQRASIARAIVADPPVLVLDEPTLGLDVMTNRVILDFVRRQREAGKTILLSTHYLDEAERLCDRVGLLHRGRLVAEGDLDSLRARVGRQRLSEIFLALVGEADRLSLAVSPAASASEGTGATHALD